MLSFDKVGKYLLTLCQGRLASIFNLLKNIGAWVENNLTTWKNIHPWRNLAISYILD